MDGVNDAPALPQAHAGLATATAIADAIRLSCRAMRIMRQNLGWAFLFNAIGIPIAAGVLYPLTGTLLSPILASAAMAFSSVAVIGNSLRLGR